MPRPYPGMGVKPESQPVEQYVDYKGGIRPFHNPYFSGTQTKIWIGDIWLDEVVHLAYSESESKIPIFGYASRYYDTIARGRSMVNGSFTINYKFNGWLNLILNRLFSNPTSPDQIESDFIDGWISRRIEAIDDLEAANEDANATSFAIDLINQLSRTAPSERTKEFNKSVEALRKRIWGVQESEDISHINDYNNFDISITFGIPPDKSLSNRLSPYGSFSAERIIGVSLVGRGKQITVDGQPILEEYQFIAQSVV